MIDDPAAGRLLAGRYRLGDVIGRGGMANVYRARDERLERDVAVKVLQPPYADDPAFAVQFLAEARAAGSITHPNLIHVYDSGTDDGVQFIVMELLERYRSLRQVLDEAGPLDVDETVDLGRQLLAGLSAVHERGLVHSDVKAGNVMYGAGPPKLIDFGIARMPAAGPPGETSMGSLHAMSPEQLRGERLTPASDIFALGAVLYEALTGQVPYRGDTPAEVADALAAGSVRPPSTLAARVAARLDDVILRALRPDPTERFGSADEMARAIDGALEGAVAAHDADETMVVPATVPRPDAGYEPPLAFPRTTTETPHRPRRRRSAWRVVGSALLLAVVALVVVFVVVPLLQSARGPGTGPETSGSQGLTEAVTVPNTIGLAKADAIAAAEEAGLDWTIQCAEDASRPEGMVDQEPPAGTEARRGSPFTMYSARFADCQ